MIPRVVDISHHNTVQDLARTAAADGKHEKGAYRQRGLTIERLKKVLRYDPETGLFYWLVRKGPQSAGSIAGHVNAANGYVYIGVDGEIYLAQCLAWFFVKGAWPEFEIDHRDLTKTNNKWGNLREASSAQNCANRVKRADSFQPYKGVHKKGNKWRAVLTVRGVRRSLGYFDTPEKASAAYLRASVQANGEFARV